MLPKPTFFERLLNARINLFIFRMPLGTGHHLYTTDNRITESDDSSEDSSEIPEETNSS